MEVYLVRHGQSMANARGTVSRPTTPLTAKGKVDAKNAGKMLKGTKFDKIFTSPYLRAIQTQEIAMGVKGEILDCIHEFDCGKMEGHTWDYCLKKYCKNGHILWEDDDFSSVGGESYFDVRARAREFLAYLETLSCERVVAFSHAGFMLTLLDEILHHENKKNRNIDCDNGCVCVIHNENGEWRIRSWNVKNTPLRKKKNPSLY